MAIIFLDIHGILYCNLVPLGQTVNSSYYTDILKKLKRAIKKKRPEITPILHHDNVSSQRSMMTKKTIRKLGFDTLPHPPYSPDLAPSDFRLFPNVKKHLKCVHHETQEGLKQALQGSLKLVSENGLQFIFEEWQKRKEKVIF